MSENVLIIFFINKETESFREEKTYLVFTKMLKLLLCLLDQSILPVV